MPITATQTPTPEAVPVEETAPVEEAAPVEPGGTGEGFRVILYNDDFHSIDEVVMQLLKATGYPGEVCWHITLEAHQQGRAVCYKGSRDACHKCARILREIRLQCEVDCD